MVVKLRGRKANTAIFQDWKQKRLLHRLQSPVSIHYSANKKEGPSLMKRMETYKSFHQTGSLCIYHFGEKIVNFLDKVKNNDLVKVKIMVLTLIFHYTIIHFIEILGSICRSMYSGKKGI